MRFDPTISLGNVIQGGLLIVAIIGGVIRFGRLEQKMDTVWNWFEGKVIGADVPPKRQGKPNGKYLGIN